jgi:hypothetical protein
MVPSSVISSKSKALATLAIVVVSTTIAFAQAPTMPAPDQATPAAPGSPARPPRVMPDPYAGKKKLLIIADVQSGFQHDSINHAMEVIGKITRDSGLIVSFIRTDSQLVTKGKVTASSTRYSKGNNNGRNLSYFDGIFFLGSGEGTMSDQQKTDLISFVHDDGKGLIIGHAATIAFYNWPAWGDMIAGFMQDGEYPASGMNAVVTDPSWPGASAFGKTFFWPDQFP